MNNKRGVFELSFSMIFSIILIIAFVATAIYVIIIFLDWRDCANTGFFKESLQQEVDRALNSDGYNNLFSGLLPGKIGYVCLADLTSSGKGKFLQYYEEISQNYDDRNMFFIPGDSVCKGQASYKIEHIDIRTITKIDNPYCFKNKKGNTTLQITKEFGSSVVLK